MTNCPMGWRGWRTCVFAAMMAAVLTAPARVSAQVTSYAYISPGPGTELVIIDTRTNTAVGTPIAVGGPSFAAAPTPDGRRVYVTRRDDANVGVLDAVTRAFVGTPIAIGNGPYGIALTPDGGKAYVALVGDASVRVIETATNTVIATIPVGVSPTMPALSPDGTRIFVPNFNGTGVSVIDTATDTAIGGPLSLGCGSPIHASFNLDGSRAYISCFASNSIKVVDVATTTVVNTISPASLSRPRGSVLTPDGARLLIGNLGAGKTSVDVLDMTTETLLPSIAAGGSPAYLAITPDRRFAYVTNADSNNVMVLDLATNAVVATIPTPAVPQSPQNFARFIGPNIITTECAGCGALDVPNDAALTPLGFAQFVNFHTGIISLSGDWTTARTISILAGGGTIDTNGHDAILSAPVINDGVLTKTGAGALTLNAASSHAGGTDLTQGVLIVNAAHTGPVTLQAGTLLEGTGHIGSIAATGGTISPGVAGPGVLSAETVTMNAATTLAIEINGTSAGTDYDRLAAAVATLGGATLNLALGFAPLAGESFTIVTNATGTFAGLAEGQTIAVNGHLLRLTYHGGAGSDVMVTAELPPGIAGLTNQLVLAGQTLGPIAFTVTDVLTPPGDLLVTASSSNQAVLPDGAIMVGGTGANRTLTGTPVAGVPGATTITVTVTDTSGLSAQQSFLMTADVAPTITGLSNDTLLAGQTLGPIAFTIGDDLTPAADLVITASSSNAALLPNSAVILGGAGANRTLSATPVPAVSGPTTITVTVTDANGQSAQQSFVLTADVAPTITGLSNHTLLAGQTLGPLVFTIGDDLTPAADLVITASSSNAALLPNSAVILGGAGANRTLSATPVPAVSGPTTITVTVTDANGQSAQQSFVLTVDLAPTIDGLTDQTVLAGQTLGPIAFDVGDDALLDDLSITATSSNAELLPAAVIVFGGTGANRTLTATPVPGATGTTTITVTVTDASGQHAEQSFVLTVQPRPVYYLSEGATGAFFSTDLLIANPNSSSTPVEITFFKDDGTTVLHTATLAATSRTTMHLAEIAGLEAAAFSTAVVSTAGTSLIVERTMTWDASGYGAHTEKASPAASAQWYFAEGSQGFFRTYFLLLNPHPVATTAHVTYFREGEPAVQRDYSLAATSRLTIDASADAALVNRSFGALVAFDLPGMAERAMYFGDAPVFSGGHASAGVTAPALDWFLAEGATGSFFDTFVLIANPSPETATLDVTYFPEGGVPVERTHTLAGHQRLTINIATEAPALANAAVSTRIESDRPVVVERAQYWPSGAWHEAHNSAGETAAGTAWGLAEGRVGGPNHAQTYILIANPGASPAEITATFLRTDGTTIVKSFDVPATSRFTIAVNGPGSHVPELGNEEFGTKIVSTQPVIVERALYMDVNGVIWAAGTDATATRLPTAMP